jgi:hypothetical protein
MKKISIILVSVTVFGLLAGCFARPTVTFYLISQNKQTGSRPIGCNEFLIPIQKQIDTDKTASIVLETLFNADPLDFGADFTTASALKDHFITLEKTTEPVDENDATPIGIYLKTNPEKGLTGVCDAPRIKEQITSTIGEYSTEKQQSFTIFLNGSSTAWKCLGDESGQCA